MTTLFVLALSTTIACFGSPDEPWTFNAATLQPFWRCEVMEGESVLFLKDDAAEPKAAVLFLPTKIVSVCSSSGEIVYVKGRDYVWKPGTRELMLPAGSRIPVKTPQDMRCPAGSQRHRLTYRDGNGEILFGGGHEYHDMQTLITYEHKLGEWSGPVPSFAGRQLSHTLKKLKNKQPLLIALLGDSISTGCNASGWAKTPPFQPPFPDLLARNLETAYGGKITLKVYARGGAASDWGLKNIGKVSTAKPDLVLIAFGMNDNAAGRSATRYQANIQAMIDAVRKKQPNAEFILVATMLGNTDWTRLNPELFTQYRDALAKLCGPGIALADMTSIWAELLKHKKYWDMTGNGVNHPNDFGHRVYAQVISTLLICNP